MPISQPLSSSACSSQQCSGQEQWRVDSVQPVAGRFIVRLKEYKLGSDHGRALSAGMGDSQQWRLIERQNAAARFPTDFALVEIDLDAEEHVKVSFSSIAAEANGTCMTISDFGALLRGSHCIGLPSRCLFEGQWLVPADRGFQHHGVGPAEQAALCQGHLPRAAGDEVSGVGKPGGVRLALWQPVRRRPPSAHQQTPGQVRGPSHLHASTPPVNSGYCCCTLLVAP